MAEFIVIMRGYDPAGMQYVYWESDGFDASGADYVGPPAFGTLLGVVAIKQVPVNVPPGFSAFPPVFDPTQEVSQTTETSAQFSDSAELREDEVFITTISNGPPAPAGPTTSHPAYNTEHEPSFPESQAQSGNPVGPSLHIYEAI